MFRVVVVVVVCRSLHVSMYPGYTATGDAAVDARRRHPDGGSVGAK